MGSAQRRIQREREREKERDTTQRYPSPNAPSTPKGGMGRLGTGSSGALPLRSEATREREREGERRRDRENTASWASGHSPLLTQIPPNADTKWSLLCLQPSKMLDVAARTRAVRTAHGPCPKQSKEHKSCLDVLRGTQQQTDECFVFPELGAATAAIAIGTRRVRPGGSCCSG